MTSPHTVDVLIVGGGIMGASVAARLRAQRPDAQITMVDAGPAIADGSGHHLHESADPETWERYNQRVAVGIQGLYVGDETYQAPAASLAALEPGMHRLSAFGNDPGAFEGAALGWNVGGMGVHWTAATPWPEEAERFGGDAARWEHDLGVARELLHVSDSPLGPTNAGAVVLDALNEVFADVATPGREAQAMPMAVQPVGERRVRSGPAVIFPPIESGDDPLFDFRPSTQALALLTDGESVTGARVRSLATGAEAEIAARTTIVCADALRTPQLLFASGIRPAALGAYLNEHAFVTNRVLLDLDRHGVQLAELPAIAEGETVTDSLWLPANSPAQPYHVQIMCRTYIDEQANPLAYGVGASVYVPTDVRAENRLVFSDDAEDITGMPRMRVEFSYSDADRARIAGATDLMSQVAGALGEWSPETDSKVLSPGVSLHFTGTVRSGDVDDGTSVCDNDGRVWGLEGLYVAGNGVIPTALACNSTLTGVVTAVRAADAVAARTASFAEEEGAAA